MVEPVISFIVTVSFMAAILVNQYGVTLTQYVIPTIQQKIDKANRNRMIIHYSTSLGSCPSFIIIDILRKLEAWQKAFSIKPDVPIMPWEIHSAEFHHTFWVPAFGHYMNYKYMFNIRILEGYTGIELKWHPSRKACVDEFLQECANSFNTARVS